ncbi:hypothetical protein PPACK8108_LOCUS24093 [Phakopsora pachyrhizi]|uniref:Uncharacterized protein n=1 Tax=Phakopsora pachyrhizi TaxID=170000 RepID=A0AAV0BP27_PHAPC|nr:hypothetical protein PPACK8108_LOCUS24093 [Phakopsora pachyrhizi]
MPKDKEKEKEKEKRRNQNIKVREVLECSVSVYGSRMHYALLRELLVTSKQLECQHFRRVQIKRSLKVSEWCELVSSLHSSGSGVGVGRAPEDAVEDESRIPRQSTSMLDAPGGAVAQWAACDKLVNGDGPAMSAGVLEIGIKSSDLWRSPVSQRDRLGKRLEASKSQKVRVSLTAKEAGPMVFTPRQEKGLVCVERWKDNCLESWALRRGPEIGGRQAVKLWLIVMLKKRSSVRIAQWMVIEEIHR